MARKKPKQKKKIRGKLASILIIVGFVLALLAIGTLTGHMISSSSLCGNLVCEVGETPRDCPEDCFSLCGDHICQGDENLTCRQDCTGNFTLPAPKQVSLLDGILGWFK